MRVLYHHCYHVIISLCFPDSWLCLFNELATRWSERSVPVSFIQITFMMNTPHPVTSHKASTLHSMQHNTEKYVAANSSDPPCWGGAVPSDLIRHNSLLLWGNFAPPECLWQLPEGRTKHSCVFRRHTLFLIGPSAVEMEQGRGGGGGGQMTMWEELWSPFGFFLLLPSVFAVAHLWGVFQALRNKEMSFSQLLLWSLWVLGWLSFLTECLALDTLPLFFFLASFRLQPFFFFFRLTSSLSPFLFFPLSTVEQIWIIHFDERYCRVCMPSVLAYVFAWWGHMGCSLALSVYHKSLSFVCVIYKLAQVHSCAP